MKFLKFVALSAVVASLPSVADAAIEGYANINLSAFGVYNNAGGGALGSLIANGTELSVVSASFTSSADGDITSIAGGPVSTSNAPGTSGTPAGLNTLQAFEGVGAPPAQNTFSNVGGLTPFARGDTTGAGAIIGGLGFSTPASVSAVSEVELESGLGTSDSGLANSAVTSTAAFLINVGASPLSAVFDLMIDRSLVADLTPFPPGNSASADTSFNITITQVGAGNVFSWAPDGILGPIFGGVEYADPFDVNTGISGFPGATNSVSNAKANFRAGVTLAANAQYSITIQTSTQADASKIGVIPEPVSLITWVLLSGAGFATVGVRGRRI